MSWLLLVLAITGDVAGTVALDRVAGSRHRRTAVACFALAAAAGRDQPGWFRAEPRRGRAVSR